MRHQLLGKKDAPIGILDSGLGGLTTWAEVRSQLPHESIVYVGDHAYQPYGAQQGSVIRNRVKQLIQFLLAKKVKLIVVACNTATVAGIDTYRRWFPRIPIIGVVPVVKTAASMTRRKHFMVLSTPNTAASPYQKHLIETFAGDCRVENIGIPDLVTYIEKGESDERIVRLLRRFLQPETLKGVDVIVLGCTHFPFITRQIRRIAGDRVLIIDSAPAVARHVARVLAAEKLRSDARKPYTEFYTTGDAHQASRVATNLTGITIKFTYAKL
ncbi:MAG: glutamate racemase [Patescibacteria group bacterium]